MALRLCKNIIFSVASGVFSYVPVPTPIQKVLDLAVVFSQQASGSFQQIQRSISEPCLSAHHITLASDSPEMTDQTRRYVIGLLASTALKLNHWQATDFVALNALLDCPEENSSWLCGEEIRSGPGFLLGDPACDRIIFVPPPFEEIVDTVEPVGEIRKLIGFRYAYLQPIRDFVPKLTADDTLFLVICGHGSEEGIVFLGDAYHHITLHPFEVECALEGCAATVYLIITACFSGRWKSKRWNLIAAAGADQESVSIVESDSGHFRGGLFTTALLAEHADQYGLRAPKPGPVTDTPTYSSGGYSNPFAQMEHDFGPPRQGQRHPMLLLPRKRTSDVLDWLHKLRNDMGRTYASADFKICPCREDDTVWKPLFADLTNSPALQRNNVQPPSRAPLASGNSSPILQNTESVLLEENEKVLLCLARDHLRFAPPETLGEVYLLRHCNALVNDGSLTAEEKAETVKILKQRDDYRFLARSIAHKLGWQNAAIEVGCPFTEQRWLDHNLSLQAEAADHGYLLWDLHVFQINTPWKGAAGWLARVWEAAGKPTIDAKEWMDTLEDCSEFAGITLGFVQ
ncbi:uncharacterized protein LACBIDRAFT_325290 [Laccaria bicolor S238N-H82]|uniref:Predicted protein n=1 Tax=Laccaria bicolor (strain S238N-H82 / ATCC MYA-4686) TaxID=486041 RepID=B0D4F9_LACBS|nr:uncharacterized protein LACBIDRAFT_325290 [Laccaria bicolor S238N-H82]EDR10556.1 predicted protein [Laccaria bicolor S238N-H82]|eukprot:XP_001879006.1 predicted protein [Laccaria bicolor S238N-H82]